MTDSIMLAAISANSSQDYLTISSCGSQPQLSSACTVGSAGAAWQQSRDGALCAWLLPAQFLQHSMNLLKGRQVACRRCMQPAESCWQPLNPNAAQHAMQMHDPTAM